MTRFAERATAVLAAVATAGIALAPLWASSGSPLVAEEVAALPIAFVLGDDVFSARRSAAGWVGVRFVTGRSLNGDVVVEAARGQTEPRVLLRKSSTLPRLVGGKDKVWLRFEETSRSEPTAPRGMMAIEGGRLLPIDASFRFEWAVQSGKRRAFVVGNLGDAPRSARWQLGVVEGRLARRLASASNNETAVGAAMRGDDVLVAVKQPDGSAAAPVGVQVRALTSLLRGDGTAAAALAGPARGSLLHFAQGGTLRAREPLVEQRPAGLAVTDDGWLVVLGEGTLAKALRDAVLIARAPGETTGWRVLAGGLEMPGQLLQRGGWVCFSTMPGDSRVIHCVNPARGLHVATAKLSGNVNLFDIELGKTPRLVFRQHRYGADGPDRTLAMALP